MPENRPRILLVTRNLPPLVGGMERLNLELARAITANGELAVVGPLGCAEWLELPTTRVSEVQIRPLPLFLARAASQAIRMGRRLRPDLVLAGSGLTAPLAFLAARACGARFVVYVHGLDLVVRSLPYRLLWLPAVRNADLVLANSRNTRQLAIDREVPVKRIAILHPGTDLPATDADARDRFRAKHIPDSGPLLLSVGRLTRRKGLAEFIEHSLPTILQHRPDVKLLVIGADANDAVRPGVASERARIERAAQRGSVSHAVTFMPPCDDGTLSDAYFAADAHVFPVRDLPGDVEGFGMVAIEAAAHGLPTVAFDAGGVADAVVAGQSGTLVVPDDYTAFAHAVLATLQEDASITREQCRGAAARFGWGCFGRRLGEMLDALERFDG